MPPLAAAADFLVIEFVAGDRRIPHAVFDSILASLSSPSALPRTSQRLRQAQVLRALDASLHTEGASCSSTLLLRKARNVLADPDAAACFPHQTSFAENEENDEARAAAAVADLKRLLDLEWANLPPSALELAADRVAGDESHQTWAAADHTKHQPILTGVADNCNDNEAGAARRYDEDRPSNEINEADRVQEVRAGHQTASVNKKCSLMDKNPNASTYHWSSSDDDQPAQKRKSPSCKIKPYPSPTCIHKIRKKWSEIEKKTLLEGVEKYGKGNWTNIKLAYPDIFEKRSSVDLKDKFRNLERHHYESA